MLFINDLPDAVTSWCYLFADDTKVARPVACKEDALLLQRDLDELQTWSSNWLLKFHPDKCKIISVGAHENIKHCHLYKIDDIEIEHGFQMKDLGVTIDADLRFDDHIHEIVKKANSMMGIIRRSFSHLDSKLFKLLFPAFVRSHLEYNQAVWAPSRRSLINLIEGVQIRATKLVDNLGHLVYEYRLRAIGLPTLAFRRMRGDLIELFKHFTAYDPAARSPRFATTPRPSDRRPRQVYRHDAADGIRGVQYNSFYFHAAPIWNDLPASVVSANTMNTFKRRLDMHLKDHPLRYDYTWIRDV